MADAKLSDLTALAGADVAANDLFYVVDVSATTTGSKKITRTEFFSAVGVPIVITTTDGIDIHPTAGAASSDIITVYDTTPGVIAYDRTQHSFTSNLPLVITTGATYAVMVNGTANGTDEITIRADNAGTGMATMSVHATDGGSYAQLGWGIDNADGSTLHSWHAGIANELDDDWQLVCGGMAAGDRRIYVTRGTPRIGFNMIPLTTSGICGLVTASGENGICLTNSITDDAVKNFKYRINHYDIQEEPISWITAVANATTSILYVGGGTTADNACTEVKFYVTAANTTLKGDQMMSLTTNALTFTDGCNIAAGTTTGTKIGTGATQKLGFWNATPVVQPTAVADATGAGDVVAQLNALLAKLRTIGIIAT